MCERAHVQTIRAKDKGQRLPSLKPRVPIYKYVFTVCRRYRMGAACQLSDAGDNGLSHYYFQTFLKP